MQNKSEPLLAISPLDGRYAEKLSSLSEYFSEFALIRARARVELQYILAIDKAKIFTPLTQAEKNKILDISDNFRVSHAVKVKEIELKTRHDVKALEIFLREHLNLAQPNIIHFGLTSEDVNNLAYSITIRDFLHEQYIPALKSLLVELADLAELVQSVPFPAFTHGQPASPSTAGKELAVWLQRLRRCAVSLHKFRFSGKCGGATGTWATWTVVDTQRDWPAFFEKFVDHLGFDFNPVTTQIEDHDRWAEFFNLIRQINNIIVDLDQDMWLWLMQGWYTEQPVSGETGSSTMPHKINPIRFENSEGNLLLGSHLLAFLSDKLCRSRLQRDLSDSTVTRNIGVALSHSILGILETTAGIKRVHINKPRCISVLHEHPELLAEAIQTMLRPVLDEDPYMLLKDATRGKRWCLEDQIKFISHISEKKNLSPDLTQKLLKLDVEKYIGKAEQICMNEIREIRMLLEKL